MRTVRHIVLIAAGAALFVGVGAWLASKRDGEAVERVAAAPPAPAHFVGSERCAECHAQESQAWRGSQHALAMQRPTAASVLGDFDDATFTYAGVTSRFSRRDDRFVVRTDGPDGELADFEVKYVFGVYPLQQYLLELPRGHVQALSIAWDSRPATEGGQRWFHLYPDERVTHDDELHWTRRQQNWNFMCADCHSTNVEKRYDATTDTYATSYAEISVGCEACHGPGSSHLEWARARTTDPSKGLTARLDERRGVTWSRDPATGQPRRSAPRTTQHEIEACAPCHARRSQLAERYRAGQPFADHYLPAMIDPVLYHPDGQQRDEVYVWGSWLQSKMHRAGVTCSDCHDPHTQKLRAPGNTVCAQCHDAAKYDSPAHHHHVVGTSGAHCVDCHMPRATYMVVDPRRDHAMRVPRPDQSASLGVPNACNACHRDRDATWAATQVRAWLGRDARGIENFAAAFRDAESGDPGSAERLAAIGLDATQPPIVRASALARLARLGRGLDDPSMRVLLADADPWVRLGAVRLAEAAGGPGLSVVAPLLGDPVLALRTETARVLAPRHASLPPETWQRAAGEYVATLRYTADRPESNVALGGFLALTGQPDLGAAAFATAIRLDPAFEPAYVNAADVLRAGGRDADALATLQQGLQQVPDGPALHHALGLAQARLQQTPDALESLRRAHELAPDVARYAYVYAVALHSTGHVPASIALLERGVRRWPYDRDQWLALASFQAGAGQRDAARRTVAKLLARFPADADAQSLAVQLQ